MILYPLFSRNQHRLSGSPAAYTPKASEANKAAIMLLVFSSGVILSLSSSSSSACSRSARILALTFSPSYLRKSSRLSTFWLGRLILARSMSQPCLCVLVNGGVGTFSLSWRSPPTSAGLLSKPTGWVSVDRSIDRACKKFLLRATKAKQKISNARFGGNAFGRWRMKGIRTRKWLFDYNGVANRTYFPGGPRQF